MCFLFCLIDLLIDVWSILARFGEPKSTKNRSGGDPKCDIFFVVGSRNSYNSVRLVEVALAHGVKEAFLIPDENTLNAFLDNFNPSLAPLDEKQIIVPETQETFTVEKYPIDVELRGSFIDFGNFLVLFLFLFGLDLGRSVIFGAFRFKSI